MNSRTLVALSFGALFLTACHKAPPGGSKAMEATRSAASSVAGGQGTIAINECVDPSLSSLVPEASPTERFLPPRPLNDVMPGTMAQTHDGRVHVVKSAHGWVLRLFRPEGVRRGADGYPDLHYLRGAFSPAYPLLQGLMNGTEPVLDPATGMDLVHALALSAEPGARSQPYESDANGSFVPRGAFRTYRLIVHTQRYRPLGMLGMRKLTIVVRQAETAAAEVHWARFETPFHALSTVSGRPLHGIEPTVTADGRLIVYQGRPDNSGNIFSLVYTFNQDSRALGGWSEPRSIVDMHHVHRAANVAGVRFDRRYPIALEPLRRPDGSFYAPGALFPGAYPWVDQDANVIVGTASVGGPPAVRSMRVSLSVIGKYTGWTLRHIDGNSNPTRTATVRTFFSSPGIFGTSWTPFPSAAGLPIPIADAPLVMPLFGIAGEYDEVTFDKIDGNSVVSLSMNELVPHHGPPELSDVDATRTADISGYFNNATLAGGAKFPADYGADNNPGIQGRAIYFPFSGYLHVAASGSLNLIRHQLTIEAWVRPLVAGDTERLIVHRPDGYRLLLNSRGARAEVRTGGQWRHGRVLGSAAPPNAWTHVAVTYDGNTGALTVYQNGQEVGTDRFPALPIDATPAAPLLIGPVGANGPARGVGAAGAIMLIDEVRVSRGARSPDEIRRSVYRVPVPRVAVGTLPRPEGLTAAGLRITEVPTPLQVELGRHLFYDKRLSADGTISCASCHDPAKGFSDGRTVPRGIGERILGRNSPTLFNRAFGKSQFMDGRARSLEEQALHPLVDAHEMGNRVCGVIQWLGAAPAYRDRFVAAYGEAPTARNLARALAAYQVMLLSGGSREDRYRAGEAGALSPLARHGREVFFGKGRCVSCHGGTNFSDERFHNTGTALDTADLGRMVVSRSELDREAFKTPTLRNIAQTAPYFHGGTAATLRDVVDHYVRGGTSGRGELSPLDLSAGDRDALVLYLESLSGSPLPAELLGVDRPLDAPTPRYPAPSAPLPPPSNPDHRFVQDAYRLLLERNSSGEEQVSWARALKTSGPVAVLLGIFHSPEARGRHALARYSTAAYVTWLYEVLFKRTPGPGELRYWYEELRSGRVTRAQAVQVFFETAYPNRSVR